MTNAEVARIVSCMSASWVVLIGRASVRQMEIELHRGLITGDRCGCSQGLPEGEFGDDGTPQVD